LETDSIVILVWTWTVSSAAQSTNHGEESEAETDSIIILVWTWTVSSAAQSTNHGVESEAETDSIIILVWTWTVGSTAQSTNRSLESIKLEDDAEVCLQQTSSGISVLIFDAFWLDENEHGEELTSDGKAAYS